MLSTHPSARPVSMAGQLSSICFLFETYAKQYPKTVAVDGLGEPWTYAALNDKANQLAHYLISQGIGAGDLVGVCLERSCSLIVSVLGVLKAGAAYVPLDPSYPPERLAYMLEQAEVSLILTQTSLGGQFTAGEQTYFCFDTHTDVLDNYPAVNPNLDSSTDHLGYLIYTSGSTGRPKGVAMPQGALQNLIRWQLDNSVVTTGRTLQFTPISFDVSFQEIFATLSAGGTLVLISDATRRDPYRLIKVLQQQSIERLYLPFVALQQLAEVAVSLNINPESLREVITAGEQLRITPALTQWFSQMPQCRLHNHYGPSESHVVTAHRLSRDPSTWPVLPPIGQPIDNVEIHLLGQDLEPVQSGEIGEIFIGGACLAKGYLGHPSITAERFIQSDLGRVYKTGDLARCLPNGDYEYLGRSDQQVKIRGYRVELGEIESALDRQPGVKEAVVIAKEEPNGHRRLVGYVVAQSREYDAQLGVTLRQALGDCLPDYMVPSQIVCLEAFPLTPSGKIDRRNLPNPIVSGKQTAPETPLEKTLADIWSTVLNVPSVGIHQTFFELGGDSLLATQVLIRIRAQLEYELPVQQLFETPTVHTLAQWILTHQAADAAITIHPADRSQPLPLAWVQETLWFLDQLIPGHPFYNVPEAFRLKGPVNTVALQRSLQTIVDRHETLRTTFDAQTGRPLQVVHSQVTCPFEVLDLSALSARQWETAIETHLVEAARVPFDLSKDVLLRGTLFKLATDDHILLLNLHHIVCDGWSVSVLIQELTALYTAFSTNQSPSLPDLSLQFGDFSQWHRQWLTAEMYDQQLTYWKDRLGDGVPMLELPRDFPRPVMPSYEGGRHFWSLPKQVTQRLKALSQETGTTLYMTLLAAFQTLLHRYSGQDDIAVGSLLANRPHPDLEKLIGFFPNTVVMRTDMAGQPSFRELLGRVKETTLAAYKYRDLPFDQLVQALHPDHQPGQNPFFQVVFNLQNTPDSMWELPDLQVSPIDLCNGTTKFDLFLELFETPDGLTGYFEYSTDLFKPATIERMVGHFQILLDAIGYQSDQPVAMLPILPEAEQQQLLVDWNQTQVDYPLEVCLHQLFEAQVEKTPDAPAAVFEGQQLTYQQLNQRANCLANYLQTVGVGPESMVGICLERSLEMVVGLLGILKSGGAYVPIDPTYPQERLGFMLADAQVPVLLTSAAVAEQLPPCPGKQLCLDRDWEEICGVSDRNLTKTVKAHNLAYVIYTSGSTGKPKGAMNTHRGIVNRLLWMQDQYPLTSEDNILQKTPFCFDVSVWEFFWPLITGAKLVVARPEGHKDRDYLVQLIAKERITTLHFVPSMLQIFLGANSLETCDSLKRVICSGEALPFDLQSRFFERLQCELHNLYGPTEAAIDVTYWQCQPDSELQKVPIGKPVANTQLYILDAALNPLPMGAVGELHIAGVQLARGYHNRPELTAEKFIFHRELDCRLYKTGDLCRFLPDGNIEYLGRVDHQVKIRGFRIELGDIESTLCQHDTIQEAVVVPWEGATGDKQLVAYVVADQNKGEVAAAETQVQTQQWQTIFDETYRQSTTETDPTFNITGWIDSYTGTPIPAEAMREWVDYTVDRILAVQPRRILEIGCGTGLLLYGLAPYCQQYQGIDLSVEGIELIRAHLQQHYPDWCVDLAVGAADGVSQEALSGVDTVILNSVVQYFPDVDYLVNVLEQLVQGLPVGSHIFVGDVRSLPLLEAFHTTVQLVQADGEQSVAELRDRIQEQLAKERELVIHPEFFQALQQYFPRISHVDIQLKQGQYLNEMTQFRYDVTLSIGQEMPLELPSESLQYYSDMDINVLEQYLVQVSPEQLRVEQVYNARLAHTLAAMALLEENTDERQTVADLRDTLNRQNYPQGIDPDDCWQLGAKVGYRVSITESTTQVGTYSVVFEQ